MAVSHRVPKEGLATQVFNSIDTTARWSTHLLPARAKKQPHSITRVTDQVVINMFWWITEVSGLSMTNTTRMPKLSFVRHWEAVRNHRWTPLEIRSRNLQTSQPIWTGHHGRKQRWKGRTQLFREQWCSACMMSKVQETSRGSSAQRTHPHRRTPVRRRVETTCHLHWRWAKNHLANPGIVNSTQRVTVMATYSISIN